MPNLKGNDRAIREVLTQAKVIAVVGHSDKPERTSYQIAQFLQNVGYIVYPVNPAVERIGTRISYPTLQAVPEPVDIVNVFRRSEFLPDVVKDAIAIQAKTVWAQLGVTHPQAEQLTAHADINLLMDSCIKVEYLRLKIGQADWS